MIRVHVINEETGATYKTSMEQVPRPGDEVRMDKDRYFEVSRVVWCLDEDGQRANVGVREVS